MIRYPSAFEETQRWLSSKAGASQKEAGTKATSAMAIAECIGARTRKTLEDISNGKATRVHPFLSSNRMEERTLLKHAWSFQFAIVHHL